MQNFQAQGGQVGKMDDSWEAAAQAQETNNQGWLAWNSLPPPQAQAKV
jgi:hypothetical protein